jgi:hypothetical protein
MYLSQHIPDSTACVQSALFRSRPSVCLPTYNCIFQSIQPLPCIARFYLFKYPAPPGLRRHFAVWVPSSKDDKIGTIIQVLSTPSTRFSLDIQHGSDVRKAWLTSAEIELGVVECKVVIHPLNGQLPDTSPVDKPKSVTRYITSPGPSRNPLITVGVGFMTACARLVGEYVLTSSHTERKQKIPRVDCQVH